MYNSSPTGPLRRISAACWRSFRENAEFLLENETMDGKTFKQLCDAVVNAGEEPEPVALPEQCEADEPVSVSEETAETEPETSEE